MDYKLIKTEKYGLRVIRKKNLKSGDNFFIIQYKFDCMNKEKFYKLLKYSSVIGLSFLAGQQIDIANVVSNIISIFL